MASSVATFHRKYKYTVTQNGVTQPTQTVDDGIVSKTNFVSKGGPVKDWRKIIANGGNATTALSGEKWTIMQSPCSLNHGYQHRFLPAPQGSSRVKLSGNLLPLSIPGFGTPTLNIPEASANNLALTRYYSNLAGVQSRFQGMVVAGELKQSLSMIRHPARALRNGVGNYLSTIRNSIGRVAKRHRQSVIRKTWLEYSFGWVPLINDIDGAIDAFYASKHAHPIFEMVKGTGKEVGVTVNPLAFNYDVGAGHRLYGAHRSEEEVYVKYFGIYRSENTGIPNPHKYGFSPHEFIPTLWELMPYSFLVDYFTNIGGILSSWSYRTLRNGWTAKTVRRSFRHTCEDMKYKWLNTTWPDSTYTHDNQGSPGSASYEFVVVNRNPDVDPGLPTLELQVPGKWTQWANIVALTAGLTAARKAVAR